MSIDLSQILSNFQIDALNTMQEQVIQMSTEKEKIVLLSNTGSGKTLAFLIPLLYRFTEPMFETQALVIAPTRELAVQIETVFKQMSTGYKITACYGGHKREIEENNLAQAPKIIIGTPGRLADHIRRGNINTKTITALVLDEFDKSLEFGYTEEIRFIMESLPNIDFRMFTSATHAIDIPAYADMDDAEICNFINEEAPDWEKIHYQILKTKADEKAEDLFHFLCDIGNRSTVVFCNHKETVERIAALIKERGIPAVYYHGSMEQRDRDAALNRFRNGSVTVLVTTDLASRGLDIPNIRYVIHYQLPHTEDVYTHRNGRTARVDASGNIVCMISGEEALRSYIKLDEFEEIELSASPVLPEKPKWVTIYFPHGKKNKVNKMDIVGFLTKVGELAKEDIGLVEIKDFHSFAAIRRSKSTAAVYNIKEGRIKGKLAKIEMQR